MARERASNSDSFCRDRSATASVEFVMVMPLLVLLLFGGIEIGRLIRDFHVATKSVRDAARYLSRIPDVTCAGVGSGTVDGAALAAVRNLALSGSTAAPTVTTDYLLYYWTTPASVNVTVDCVARDTLGGLFAEVDAVPRLTVTASIPFSFLLGTLIMENANITLTVSHNQVHIGG